MSDPLAGLPQAGVAAPAAEPARPEMRLDALVDMMLPVVIEFGRTALSVQQVLELTAGSVVPLDRRVGDPVDIYVSDRRLAEGEVVVIGDSFGIRVTRILPVQRDASARAGGR